MVPPSSTTTWKNLASIENLQKLPIKTQQQNKKKIYGWSEVAGPRLWLILGSQA